MNMILETIDDDIKLCEVYANYWMAMAMSGVGRHRAIYHGTNGPEFTDKEKDSECMATANTHIENMRELMDKKKSMLYAIEDARYP
jgi:hypothetical protein